MDPSWRILWGRYSAAPLSCSAQPDVDRCATGGHGSVLNSVSESLQNTKHDEPRLFARLVLRRELMPETDPRNPQGHQKHDIRIPTTSHPGLQGPCSNLIQCQHLDVMLIFYCEKNSPNPSVDPMLDYHFPTKMAIEYNLYSEQICQSEREISQLASVS